MFWLRQALLTVRPTRLGIISLVQPNDAAADTAQNGYRALPLARTARAPTSRTALRSAGAEEHLLVAGRGSLTVRIRRVASPRACGGHPASPRHPAQAISAHRRQLADRARSRCAARRTRPRHLDRAARPCAARPRAADRAADLRADQP